MGTKDKTYGINIKADIFSSEEERIILSEAIEQTSVPIIITDISGDIIFANSSFEDISGYLKDEVIGKNPRLLKSGLTDPLIYEKMWQTISQGGIWNGEQINRKKDGSFYNVDLRITPIYDKDNNLNCYIAVMVDITERKKIEEKLEGIAIRDFLTNAYNRRHIIDRMKEMLDFYKRSKNVFSIAMLDIDHYKNLNDVYGHLAGDFILVEFVEIINKAIRTYDVLGRYGGEEFILLFPDTHKDEAFKVVSRILETIRNHDFLYNEDKIKSTFSAGITDSSEIALENVDIKSLIEIADKRLYEAKNEGRNRLNKG